MSNAEMKSFLLSLLYQDDSGRFYIKINGTMRKFNFSKTSDIALLNSIIDPVRPDGFQWEIARIPKCARLISKA